VSIRGRLIGLALFGFFVVWPLYWVTHLSPAAQRAMSATSGCIVKGEVLRVKVSVSRYPDLWRHMVDARRGRNTGPDGTTVVDTGLRWPTVLTLSRPGKEERRLAAFRMSGLVARAGKARDEYPPAFARTSNAADVRYVDHDRNSAQGASMGNQLRGRCDGQRFRLVAAP
jgi:hypothetical protein